MARHAKHDEIDSNRASGFSDNSAASAGKKRLMDKRESRSYEMEPIGSGGFVPYFEEDKENDKGKEDIDTNLEPPNFESFFTSRDESYEVMVDSVTVGRSVVIEDGTVQPQDTLLAPTLPTPKGPPSAAPSGRESFSSESEKESEDEKEEVPQAEPEFENF